MIPRVTTGLERLYQSPPKALKSRRLGLLANPASVTSRFVHASKVIDTIYPGQLKALFSPQHGFHAEKQDNMIESPHTIDPTLGIPIYSLYSETRIPTPEMFDDIDTLIIDIQDVGTRVYTFIYTISYCLEMAEKTGKSVIVLDRPNPIGGQSVEGNLLERGCASFVGRFPIPMRHGMTVGEIATLFNAIPNHLKERFEAESSSGSHGSGPSPATFPTNATSRKQDGPGAHDGALDSRRAHDGALDNSRAKDGALDDTGTHDVAFRGQSPHPSYFNTIHDAVLRREKKERCDLIVIPMEGWRRKMLFPDTTLPWIAPSPNLPTPMSALVYPGQVIFEGTNISEGRGTTQPFELFGAPFLDTRTIFNKSADKIEGAILRPTQFQPTSGKWQGEVCHGFQIHVEAPSLFKPYKTSLTLLKAIIECHPDRFQWKKPPYEYEYNRDPIDLILGTPSIRETLTNENSDPPMDMDALENEWQDELNQFQQLSREFHLYV